MERKSGYFLLCLIYIISLCPNSSQSSRILVVSFFSTKSHKFSYYPLIQALASRGHQITIMTSVISENRMENITEILTFDLTKVVNQKFNPFDHKEKGGVLNPFTVMEEFETLCDQTYDLPQVRNLLNQSFDLVFLHRSMFYTTFNDCALGLVYRLGAPVVVFMGIGAPHFIVNKLGGYLPPSFVPNMFLGYSDRMNFYQRFVNFGMNMLIDGVLKFYHEPRMEAIYRRKLGEDIPSISEIMGNVSLLLSNGHFSINKPKPFLPHVVEVGGGHSRPPSPLSKEIEDFISKGNEHGFLLFSLGTQIQGDKMPEEKRLMFVKVFSQLKQRILWKWESESMPDLPENVMLRNWFPQQDLLGHKMAKMFISHCGGGSTEEAIYHGVPFIALPMFADQDLNAKLGEEHGILIRLDWNTLDAQVLRQAIEDIIGDPSYAANVTKLSSIFKDQLNTPLERAIYWIEYVLRHNGAPQLKSAARHLNALQYHSFDVIAAYLCILFLLLYVTMKIVMMATKKLRILIMPKTTQTSKSISIQNKIK